ncbi:MAG: HEPN domain-containing protein [Magnetococcales bacterium]|nr:HEPN domain-containing protein [Magnetococcales bacterium]
MNIARHTDYWRKGSGGDWEAAEILLEKGKIQQGLFFLHLAMEKLIKAHVCRITRQLPPKSHNLIRLLELTGLDPGLSEKRLLLELNDFCMEGRYPDELAPPPSHKEALAILYRIQEVRIWLHNQS